jgi:hypothetical protein
MTAPQYTTQYRYCTCQNCKIIGKVKMETTGMWGLTVIILKDIKCFQIWVCFEGIGIIHNLPTFYWINLNHPQIHWSIIFIRITLEFLTFQWKRSVNKPTLNFWQMLQHPVIFKIARSLEKLRWRLLVCEN